MKFTSRKDSLFFILIYGIVIYQLYTIYHFYSISKSYDSLIWPSIVMALVSLFILSMLHGTSYKITAEKISYRCGPLFGSIKMNDIKEIVVGKTLWVGMRPATARKGLIIKYKRGFGEIYISPKTNESFVDEILKHNPEIKITK